MEKYEKWFRLLSGTPFNRRQKYETFFQKRLETPHPRFNDGVKPGRHAIIEPGAGGFIVEPGVRGIGKNWKMFRWKKFHTFVEDGRKSMKKFQNVSEKVRDRWKKCGTKKIGPDQREIS